MYKLLSQLTLCAGVASCLTVAEGAVALIESFENPADPPAWQSVSPPNQTVNAANGANAATPLFSNQHVTLGTQSGEFITTWTLPGTAASGNPHVAGDPTLYWSIRYNAATPSSFVSNSISVTTGQFTADLHNGNPYPLSVAFVFDNTLVTNQLKRGPFIEVPPNSNGTYSWDMQNPIVWVTGGTNDWGAGTNARLRSMVVYTTSTPTIAESHFFVDNIRDEAAQTDVTPPQPPVLYSAEQGPAAGNLVVTWKANTESDLGNYNVYLGTDADFQSVTTNRMTFPTTPAATVPAGTNTVTLTGVPTDQNVYVTVRAIDTATPIPNTSEAGVALGARLRGDGGAVDDHVILDYNRNAPGSAEFTLEGYLHGIVYNARALSSNNRYFDSASAAAIDAAAEVLLPSATGITVWGNLLDGSSTSSVALTTESVTALTAFLAVPTANLFISGSGVAEDLSFRGPVQQAFLATQLSAALLNANIADGNITATPPLATFGTAITTAGNFDNISAYNAASNESLAALGGATATGQYSVSAQPDAGVVHTNKVVFLGYAFESAAGGDSGTSELIRQQLMQDVITYLTGTPVNDWQLY